MLDRVVGSSQPQSGVVPAPVLASEPRIEAAESGADSEIGGTDEGVVNGDDDR
jgi:hypothetical protein